MDRMDPLGTWMTMTDRALLTYMAEYPELAIGPKHWYYNMNQEFDVSYSTVERRLRLLADDLDEPMVERDPDRGDGYTITEFGLRVVAGEVGKERIRELSPHEDGGNAGGQ